MISFFSSTPIANPPQELMEFTLCKEFGWTITELYDQPNAKVQKFIQIINQRNTLEKQKQT